jgi:hypothetical protein
MRGLAALAPDRAVVTAADMVAGHVRLDVSCLDRVYLNGYVARLQTPGGIIYFFHDHRGKPIVSPALFEPIGAKFRRDVRDWARAGGIPVISFKAGERKADVMAPYLQAAAAAGRSQVAAVGCAQEFQLVWTARRRDTDPAGCPQFSFTREQRRVSVFYVYVFDTAMGPGFIKICTYFPYPVKAWVNGHEWARQQARKLGLGFAELSNGFASCQDAALLQRICDRFGPGHVQAWFDRWMAQIPLPLGAADRDAGFWWELSMRQVETSRTLVFDDGVHARAFFEALLCAARGEALGDERKHDGGDAGQCPADHRQEVHQGHPQAPQERERHGADQPAGRIHRGAGRRLTRKPGRRHIRRFRRGTAGHPDGRRAAGAGKEVWQATAPDRPRKPRRLRLGQQTSCRLIR